MNKIANWQTILSALMIAFLAAACSGPKDAPVAEAPAASNVEKEASRETLENGFVKHVFETTPPMPTYLIAIAVGPYDIVDYGIIPPNSIRDREIPLRGIVAKGQSEKMEYALNPFSEFRQVSETVN